MAKYIVDEEFVAGMLVLNSELGFIIEEGLNPDSMEIIEAANNRLAALIGELRKEEAAA